MHTIVSWPNPKQWIIVHTTEVYIFFQSSQEKWVNWKHTASHIVQWITERICLIVLTHLTKYIWQAYYKFNVFRWLCTMMIMRWCNVQSNEYHLQAKTYPTICSHQNLHNTNEKIPFSPEYGGYVPFDDANIIWAIDISFQSPRLKWANWTHILLWQ